MDPKTIQRERKKWLAELELSPNGQLQLKHRNVDKNELLEYFETLEDPTIVGYHEVVNKDGSLAEFLETERLPAGATFYAFREYDDPDFLQWISPYFYSAFTTYAKTCLDARDQEGLGNLLRNRLLLTQEDQTRAWTTIGQLMEKNIDQLEHYYKEGSVNHHYTEISCLADPDYIRMFQLFPKAALSHWRDQYAFNIMQVAIVYFNKNKSTRARDIAEDWVEYARELAASDGMTASVDEKLREIRRLREKSRKNIAIRALIFGALAASQLLTHNHTSFPSYSFPQHTTVKYNGDTVRNAKQLDSLMHLPARIMQ